MSMALVLVIFISVVALAFGLIGSFIGSSHEANRRKRSEQESRRYASQPWDDADGRANR
jgi:hypothetical protein